MHIMSSRILNVEESTTCCTRVAPTIRQTQMPLQVSSPTCSVVPAQIPLGHTRTPTMFLLTFLTRYAANQLSVSIDLTPLLQLLRPEVDRHTNWWAWLGAVCGAGIGFIIGNLPGLMLGGVAGNRLGAVRDAKGKSVAAVFNDLGNQQKAEVIIFSH